MQKWSKNEKIVFFLTLAFVLCMSCIFLTEMRGGESDTYRITTERKESVSAEGEGSALLVDVNTANEEELTELTGIGEELASRIVRYREEHGPFQTAEELLNVEGIGKKKLEALRGEITLSEVAK